VGNPLPYLDNLRRPPIVLIGFRRCPRTFGLSQTAALGCGRSHDGTSLYYDPHPRPPFRILVLPRCKLSKVLQSKHTPDGSRTMIDPSSGGGSIASSSSHSSNVNLEAQASPSSSQTPRRKGSKLSGVKETSSPPYDADVSEDVNAADDSTDEPPIIVEPVSPRVRMRSERPLSSMSDNHLSYCQPPHSTSRLSGIPTRLSG
jgi:hypothetical protein